MIDVNELLAAYRTARQDLLANRVPAGHWVGRLASSPLAAATAISALSLAAGEEPLPLRRQAMRDIVAAGVRWLVRTQQADGGFGDTEDSRSNIATTMLVRAALLLAGAAEEHASVLQRASQYIDSAGGIEALRNRYGKDKTFAEPILTNCALAGVVDWSLVGALPFELACLPHSLLRLLRLPVVSYAVPALVAIGQAKFFSDPPRNLLLRCLRRLAVGGSLRRLEQMQPASGGFLEAVPLTSFVVMSLAATGRAGHPVVRRGVDFLLQSARSDGSWPIDTNLAAWNTTLAINALAAATGEVGALGCLDWLLNCQHTQRHPFTQAAPGGWGWTDLSGAVPDADDTSGALLALRVLRSAARPEAVARIDEAAAAGVRWLLDLQNADGGWPTFCRGWATLPFDRSAPDLTAHALRALRAWQGHRPVWVCESAGTDAPATDDSPQGEASPQRAGKEIILSGNWPGNSRQESPSRQSSLEASNSRRSRSLVGSFSTERIARAMEHGLQYLANTQRPDGSWIPLWFGNQYHPAEENPVYGTGRVLLCYRDLGLLDCPQARRGLAFLAANCRPDGGWGTVGADGGHSSVEETAIAVEALLSDHQRPELQQAICSGINWLIAAVKQGKHLRPSPIGLYFAKLWYHEELYPLVFAVAALGHAVRVQAAAAGGVSSSDSSARSGLPRASGSSGTLG